MALKLLVTGRPTKGSWPIRGVQLGGAIGAHVEENINKVNGFDAAIIVKRPRLDLLERLRQRGVPVIWDIVDSWPQPVGNEWTHEQCVAWLRNEFETVQPKAIVAATEQMAEDCKDFGVPVLALPHHHRPGIKRNPIRERVRTVGYEGGEQYLGWWAPALTKACASRGWTFVVNPEHLADVDIVVAVRHHQGYAAKSWKSAVKLANAQGSGTPCVANRECGYFETRCGGERWATDENGMQQALDYLTPCEARQLVQRTFLAHTLPLDVIAARYLKWLRALSF